MQIACRSLPVERCSASHGTSSNMFQRRLVTATAKNSRYARYILSRSTGDTAIDDSLFGLPRVGSFVLGAWIRRRARLQECTRARLPYDRLRTIEQLRRLSIQTEDGRACVPQVTIITLCFRNR